MSDHKVDRKPLSIAKYASELAKTGIKIYPGASGTFWARYESLAMVRLPDCHLTPPGPREIRQVLWCAWAAAVSFLQEPDQGHHANAYLYVCNNPAYNLDRLSPVMRRNVRRGLKELRIGRITSEELLAHGAQAFCDTRARIGLNDGTPQGFHRRFSLQSRCVGHVFLAAWKGEELAAFLSIIEAGDSASIEGSFSMNVHLKSRPNEALFFYALSHYLKERMLKSVTYGVSSIQRGSNLNSLHDFKIKVGFDAYPVHRAFVLHPLLRPIANRLTLSTINGMLWLKPRSRWLLKAGNTLASMLARKQVPTPLRESIQTD